MSKYTFNRRKFLQLSSLIGAGLASGALRPFAAFAQSGLPMPPAPGPINLEAAGGLEALIAAARTEGALSTTAPKRSSRSRRMPATADRRTRM